MTRVGFRRAPTPPGCPTRSKVRIVKGIFPKLKCCYLCNYGL